MEESYVLSVASAGGTEVCNVDRMVTYAADQLGLELSGAEVAEGWSDYRAVLSGETATLKHLLELVTSAYPAADIRVKPVQ